MRNSISKKNPYYIPKERYLELKHFCLQYPYWQQRRCDLAFDPYSSKMEETGVKAKHFDMMTWSSYIRYTEHMVLVEATARETDPAIGTYILESVVTGKSYESVNALHAIPCCRNIFYALRRKFFWILDKKLGDEDYRVV